MRYRNEFRGVSVVGDRHGRLRYRLRRTLKGRKVDSYLPGVIGSTEFRAAYEAAIDGARVTTRRAQPGTFSHLIEAYLDSAAFRNLAPTTRSDKRPRLDWIRTAIGDARYARMQPRQVEALMTKKGGPEASNRLKKDLAQLFRFAAKHFAFSRPNPAALADAYKIRSSGFHSWTDEEIASFRNHFPSGSQARLALELFFGTGAARQDAAGLTRANIRGAEIHYSRQKTGQAVVIPILPELRLELARIPQRTRFLSEAFAKEEQPSRSKIGFRFGFFLADRIQGERIIAEHYRFMPGNDAVPYFMSFAPAMLQFGQGRIEKNPPLIGKVESLKRGLPDRIDE